MIKNSANQEKKLGTRLESVENTHKNEGANLEKQTKIVAAVRPDGNQSEVKRDKEFFVPIPTYPRASPDRHPAPTANLEQSGFPNTQQLKLDSSPAS